MVSRSPSAGCRGRRQRRRGRWPRAAGEGALGRRHPNRWRVARKDRWLRPSPVSRTLRACMSMLVNSGWATMLDRHPAALKRRSAPARSASRPQAQTRAGRALGCRHITGSRARVPTSQCVGGRPGSPAAGGSGVRIGIKAVAGEGCAERRAGPALPRRRRCRRPLTELEGAFGLSAVGQEAAGLPAHPLLGMQGPHWSASARARSASGGELTA